MKIKNNLILQLITFITNFKHIFSVDYVDQQALVSKQVFTSFQTIEIPLKSICSTNILKNIIPLKGDSSDLFFALSDTCGIVVSKFSENGQYQLISNYPYASEVTAMQIHFAFKTLWVADFSKKVTIFDILNPTKIVLINFIEGDNPTKAINFSNDGKQAFLIQSGGTIQIYNIEGGKQLLLQQFVNPGNPQKVIISSNNKLMIVASFNIFFYPLVSEYDPIKPYQFSNDNTNNYVFHTDDDSLGISIVNNKYLYAWQQRSGMRQFDIEQCILTRVCDQTTIINQFDQKSLGYVLGFSILTKDNNYLVTFLNSFGIYIFDISKRQGFRIFQKIDFKGICSSMVLNSDETKILMSKDGSLNVFLHIKPYLNLDSPNILNLNQNYLFNDHMDSNTWSWHCQVMNNVLITTQNTNGVYFFDINPVNKRIKLKNKIQLNLPNSVDEFRILNDKNYILASYGVGGLYFYKQTNNFEKLDLVSSYIPPIPDADMDCVRQTKDSKTLFIASGYSGVIVVDISNILQPKHVTNIYYTFEKNIITAAENVCIGKDEKVLYGAYRYLGIVIYDISVVSKPKQVNLLYTSGGEDAVLTSDQKHLIVCDGYAGLKVYNVENDPYNPVFLNSVTTSGWTVHMKLVQNDQYILATTQQRGQLFLIDFLDRQNPKLLEGFQYQGIQNVAFDICYTSDEQTSYMVSPLGILVIPLRSTVVFHTDIIQLKDIPNSSVKQKILMTPSSQSSLSSYLLVGMNVRLQLSQIYAQNAVILKNAYYYDNYEMKILPWWIQISQNSLSISLTVNREALDQQEIQNLVDTQTIQSKTIVSKQKQIVFVLSERVVSSDFLQSSIPISSTLANNIYNDCLKKQIINDAGFLNDNIGINYISEVLKEQNYNSEVLEQIKYILRSKIIYYPVSFTIQNSLFINILQKNNIVESFSSSIQVYFYVNTAEAKFINQNYPGVLTSFSQKYDQAKIEGEIGAVNIALAAGIKIANFTNTKEISITMEVDDGVNFNLLKKFKLNETSILSLNTPVYVNPNLTIQKDFEKKFKDAEIGILEKFQYQISSEIFLDEDSSIIQIDAQIQNSNGTYQKIDRDFWMAYDGNQKVFSGTPPSDQLYTVLRLKIISSDGYTYAEDFLSIYVSNIPLSILLTIIFQILGPLVGIIGLWRYSSQIYNIYSKKDHETTCIQIRAGETFQMQIPLIKIELNLARKLWKSYFKSVHKDDLLVLINHYKQQYRDQIYELKESSTPTQKLIQDNNFENKNIERSNFRKQSLSNSNQELKGQNIFHSDINRYSNFGSNQQESQFQQKQNLDSSKKICGSEGTIISQENQMSYSRQNSQNTKYASKFNKFVKQITKLDKNQLKRSKAVSIKQNIPAEYKNCLFKHDGHINQQYLLDEIKKHYMRTNNKTQESIINDLSNSKSKLSRCLIGLASVSFAQFDLSTQKTVDYLRQQAILQFTPNDWYKKYVNIKPSFDSVLFQPFPIITINDEILQMELRLFNSLQQNLYQQNTETNFRYFLPLIKECLIAIAYGFTFVSHYFIPTPNGECLQINQQNLKSIDSCIPTSQKNCISLRKMFDLEFVEKELSVNSRLNSWIQSVDILNGVILISCNPKNQDTGRYLLKIKNELGYTIKRINIHIFYNKMIQQDLDDPQNENHLNFKNNLLDKYKDNDMIAFEFENNLIKSIPRQTMTHSNSYNIQTYQLNFGLDDETLC